MTESFYIMGVMWILDCALRIAATNGLPYSEGIPDATFRTWSRWLELGLAISLTAMLRQVILLFIPFLVLWFWWLRYRQVKRDPQAKAHALRSSLKQTVQGTVLSFVVILILIAPISAFNYHQFHRFVLLNTNAGYAFYLSNHPSYGNRYEPMLSNIEFRNLIPSDIRWMDEAALDQELLKLGFGFVLTDPCATCDYPSIASNISTLFGHHPPLAISAMCTESSPMVWRFHSLYLGSRYGW